MTDKEFKRLNRSQLIDIIYQFQLQVDTLTEQNRELERELADKRLRLNNAGSIADAALEINDCLRNAQAAADQYLTEIRVMREETEAECQHLLAQARLEALAILAGAQKAQDEKNPAVEAILEEYEPSHSDNG